MSASRAKGTRYESDVVTYFIEHGHPHCERRALGGSRDRGDIAGILSWVLELKNTKELNLAGAVDEARVEARNAGARFFAAVIKRRRRSVAESYVVMPLEVFTAWLADDVARGEVA